MTQNEEKINENSEKTEIDTQLTEITEEIIDNAPECDIEVEEIKQESNYVDNKGRFFNPEIHKTDENGLPILNKNGTLAIKRGRKNRFISTDENQENETKKFDSKNAGKLFAQYTFAFCSGIFGKEFLPVENEKINEVELISNAYADYLESKNISEVSPDIILLGSLSLYILPRLMQEKVQENILGKVKKLYRKIMKK